MELVQFHTRPTLTPAREQCLKLAKAAVPAEVSYEFSDQFPVDPRSIDPAVDRGDRAFGNRQSYSLTQASDLVKFKLASERPQMVWMDSDTVIDKWFDFPLKGKPYFNYNGSPDIAVFYVNDCPEFFANLLRRYRDDEKVVRSTRRVEWAQMFLREMSKDIYLIPEGYFRHFAIGHVDRGSGSAYATQEYQAKRNKEGKPFFTFLKGFKV